MNLQRVCRTCLAALLAACVGCARQGDPDRTVLTIAAAASLTDVFQELEPVFELQHPDIDVQFVFAGSQVLRWQIESGLSVDLFASADPKELLTLQNKGLTSKPVVFATNTLAVVYRAETIGRLRTMSDVAAVGSIVLGVEGSPIGRYTQELLMRAETELHPGLRGRLHQKAVSYEKNVRILRSKVEVGGVDAAIVYTSDLGGTHGLDGFKMPDNIQPNIQYPIAPLVSSKHPEEAQLWVQFILSIPAESIWSEHRFGQGVKG